MRCTHVVEQWDAQREIPGACEIFVDAGRFDSDDGPPPIGEIALLVGLTPAGAPIRLSSPASHARAKCQIARHGLAGDLEHLCRLLDGEPTEKSQFEDPRTSQIDLRKSVSASSSLHSSNTRFDAVWQLVEIEASRRM